MGKWALIFVLGIGVSCVSSHRVKIFLDVFGSHYTESEIRPFFETILNHDDIVGSELNLLLGSSVHNSTLWPDFCDYFDFDFYFGPPDRVACIESQCSAAPLATLHEVATTKTEEGIGNSGIMIARHSDTRFMTAEHLKNAIVAVPSTWSWETVSQQHELLGAGLHLHSDARMIVTAAPSPRQQHTSGGGDVSSLSEEEILSAVDGGAADVGILAADALSR